MITFPNGKLNLGLSVTGRRPDGFHDIETVMVPVNICDVLEMIPSPHKRQSFTVTGLDIPGKPAENLVLRAYRLLRKDFDLPPVNVHLHKVIPAGAGLGGGSSDGAFALKMLNVLFGLNLSQEKLEDYARRIGSDCAFFIGNRPVLASGRGDRFEPVEINSGSYFITVVKPEVHINTREAYSMVKPVKKEKSIREIISLPVEQWKGKLVNDFEEVLFRKYPVLKTIKDELYELGAVYASMTGSGSALYGIFKEKVNTGDYFPGSRVFET